MFPDSHLFPPNPCAQVHPITSSYLHFLEPTDTKSFPFTGKKPFLLWEEESKTWLKMKFSNSRVLRIFISCPLLSGERKEVLLAGGASHKHPEYPAYRLSTISDCSAKELGSTDEYCLEGTEVCLHPYPFARLNSIYVNPAIEALEHKLTFIGQWLFIFWQRY